MKIAIMQPYFFPYLGYFQLIKAVDIFVVYDNIKYTKKGWINRNRILLHGKDVLFTIPLVKSSDFLTVKEKFISAEFNAGKEKILAQIRGAYCKAPYFEETYPVLESAFSYQNKNLFDFVFNSVITVLGLLAINTKIVISSSLPIDHELRASSKVIAICNHFQATTYINLIGGTTLYTGKEFAEHGIDLRFHNLIVTPYNQAAKSFMSHLSIIDVLMYNGRQRATAMLEQYQLLEPRQVIL
jgi:hypothetical protein